MSIYYQDDKVTLYWGDCLTEHREWLDADALITDPPYGVGFRSARRSETERFEKISGDDTTELRDEALREWGKSPHSCSAHGGHHDLRTFASASFGLRETTPAWATCRCPGGTEMRKYTRWEPAGLAPAKRTSTVSRRFIILTTPDTPHRNQCPLWRR